VEHAGKAIGSSEDKRTKSMTKMMKLIIIGNKEIKAEEKSCYRI
jgi:hypothetical protein